MTAIEVPKIAVVGSGYWGVNHVRNFHQLNALAVVCDTGEAALSRIARDFPGTRTESSLETLLSDPSIQGIVIATPAETHFSVAQQALQAGKDVLVEKPLTLRTDEAELLIQEADKRGRLLMVGHLLEYHPAVIRLTELVRSGALGDVRYIYSSRLNLGKVRREENILWSFAPHDIAIILRITGTMPVQVTASGGAYLQPNIADVTVTNLLFEAGIRAHIFVSWLHPYKEQRLVVIGSKRMAVFDDLLPDDKLVVYDQGVEFVNGFPITRKDGAKPEKIEKYEPLRRQSEIFLECITNRRQPLTDGQSGLRVLQVLSAAEESLKLVPEKV